MPHQHKKDRYFSRKTKEQIEFYLILIQLILLLMQIFGHIGA